MTTRANPKITSIKIVSAIDSNLRQQYRDTLREQHIKAYSQLIRSLNNVPWWRRVNIEDMKYTDVVTFHEANTSEQALSFLSEDSITFFMGGMGTPVMGRINGSGAGSITGILIRNEPLRIKI